MIDGISTLLLLLMLWDNFNTLDKKDAISAPEITSTPTTVPRPQTQTSETKESDKEESAGTLPRRPIPSSPNPKRIADRPHWITIVIGVISPSIAIVAAYISISSLQTSQRALELSTRSLKVGQRAYLNVSVEAPFTRLLGVTGEEFDIVASITNTGNTPAENVRIGVDLRTTHGEKTADANPWYPNTDSISQCPPAVIGGKVTDTRAIATARVTPPTQEGSQIHTGDLECTVDPKSGIDSRQIPTFANGFDNSLNP